MLRFTAADGATPPHIVRDFQDPYLELDRLVREASEIEHALLVQYLSASFSVKSRYQAMIGTGGGDSISLVGVAVQEMHHLARVNELLTDLHAAPNLVRQDFPYEPSSAGKRQLSLVVTLPPRRCRRPLLTLRDCLEIDRLTT